MGPFEVVDYFVMEVLTKAPTKVDPALESALAGGHGPEPSIVTEYVGPNLDVVLVDFLRYPRLGPESVPKLALLILAGAKLTLAGVKLSQTQWGSTADERMTDARNLVRLLLDPDAASPSNPDWIARVLASRVWKAGFRQSLDD